MNVRISLVLLVLLALVSSYVFLFELRKPAEVDLLAPWFYDVELLEIQSVDITYNGTSMSYSQGEDQQWYFDDQERTPVDMGKFSGVSLLLSGPRSQRELTGIDLDPTLYGLDSPQTELTVGLTANRSLRITMGDITPDGLGQYARLDGSPRIFLVTPSWTEVIARLVYDPPYPEVPATPTPTKTSS